MLFHTWPFALFFLVVYPVYLALKDTRFRLPWLLAASYFFYACFNPLYLILIAYATLLDYTIVKRMAKSLHRKMWLSVSIINNIALLGFFKYGGFVTENLNALLSSLDISYAIPEPGFLLPIGISFYVFQSMSYTIDYYRGNMERENSLIAYAAFVSLFPRLVAGPIERAKNLLPQMHKTPKVSVHDVADGLSLFVVGLFKKVALADYLSLYVDNIYAAPDQYQSPALILATFLFCWQIYFDFSGYTDMARGIARMMGFNLMLNFNNPYLATGLGDFWRRWHISLSSWFKDYVYIPLGGNRGGKASVLQRILAFFLYSPRAAISGYNLFTYRNIFIVMILSGLWHGAAWTFVLWGVVHALGYINTYDLERMPFYRDKVPKLVKQLLVFAFVTFTWIFFRANSIGDAWLIITRIFTSGWADPNCPVWALVLVFSVWIYQFIYESRFRWIFDWAPVRIGLVVGMIIYLAVFAPSSEQGFIYLQF